MLSYKSRLTDALSPRERRLFTKLTTPKKVQDFLDTLKINFGGGKVVVASPRLVLERKRASCIEGALLAAASLACQGRPPLLMDFQSTGFDEDHVVALFKEGGYWGAISKTNHPVLRWRDPIYKTPRELAMSFFHEYYFPDRGKHLGEKTMRTYSAPFNLARLAPERWVATADDLDWLAVALDESRHFPVVTKKMLRHLRRASPLELKAAKLSQWKGSRRA